jgi:multiple sugar transport system substrate-binding protein
MNEKTKCVKQLCVIILVLIFPFFNIACKNDKTASVNQIPPKQNLDFRITWKSYSGRGEAIQKIINLYNEQNNGTYKINLLSGDEDLTAIEKLIQKKQSKIIYMLPYRYVQFLGGHGYLTDLSDSFANERSIFYPELFKLGQVNDITYGIPWLGHSICLIYNQDLLDQAGVDASSIKNMDSWVEAMKQVEAKTNAKGVGLVGADHNDVSWMVNQFIYGYGSSLVNQSGTRVTIRNEKSKQALDFYKNILGAHAQPGWQDHTGTEVMKCFRKQQIAFEFQGPWGVSDISQNGGPFKVGVIALEDIGLNAEVGPMMLSLPKNMSDADKDAAMNFIRFLISKSAQAKIMDGEYSPEHDTYYPFRVPVRKDLADSLVFKKYPQYIPFLQGFKHPSVDVPVPEWQTIKDQYYAPGLHQVMKSEISIDDFLTMIETKGNETLITQKTL